MRRFFGHKLLVGGVALVLAGSAGGAYAATQSGANPRQAFLNDVAKRLGVTPAQVRAAVDGAQLDALNAAVKAGQLTQAQADRIKQRIEQGGPLPLGPRGLGPVPGLMWRHGVGPGGPRRGLGARLLLPGVANYLGLSPAQLVRDLRGGKSLAQIAQAQHKSVSGLEQAMTSTAQARLASLVAAGVLTKAQEQRLLSRLSARISRLVTAHPEFFKQVRPGPPLPMGAAPPPPGPALGAPAAPPPPSA